MKQRIINKVYFVSIIKDSKVVEILRGKCIDDIMFTVEAKYKDCTTQVMEYNDEYNVYVPDVEEHLMMIRRRQANGIFR